MATAFRFGRRVPLPSTRQILHDLRMMMAADRITELERELRDCPKEEKSPGVVVAAPEPARP